MACAIMVPVVRLPFEGPGLTYAEHTLAGIWFLGWTIATIYFLARR